MRHLEVRAVFAEETTIPPHPFGWTQGRSPDPLPPAFAARQSAASARRRQGEGTAGVWLVFGRWSLGKLRHGC